MASTSSRMCCNSNNEMRERDGCNARWTKRSTTMRREGEDDDGGSQIGLRERCYRPNTESVREDVMVMVMVTVM